MVQAGGEGRTFDELAFFGAIAASGARALLIGRRALIILGLPVMTRDYDFWVAGDDAHMLDVALHALAMEPTHTPEETRARGYYAIEGDEQVDVLVAPAIRTIDGELIDFEVVWARRVELALADGGVRVAIPSLPDLILTKKFTARPRDADDVRWLQRLQASLP